MDGNLVSLVRAAERISSETLRDSPDRIIEFYEQAGLDYEHWSRGFNMHLGFYRRGLNPFDREAMLEEMNLEIAKRLELDVNGESMLLDLGCGMGSIARSVARYYSRSTVKGITLVPTQVRMASELNAQANLDGRTAQPDKEGHLRRHWRGGWCAGRRANCGFTRLQTVRRQLRGRRNGSDRRSDRAAHRGGNRRTRAGQGETHADLYSTVTVTISGVHDYRFGDLLFTANA